MEERPGNGVAVSETETEGQGGIVGVMAGAQDAADRVLQTAQTAAERLPEAVATAQAAATTTQRRLEEMPNQGLIIGTSFSLGLAVGLFLTGTNRLLVLAAIAPAAAMAATLVGREAAGEPSVTSGDAFGA